MGESNGGTAWRVLVVDDEAPARDNVRHLLARRPDVRDVLEADGGRGAVEIIVREKPDIVFLDVQMPGMDGFGVVGEVGPERMPPVVFVTAFDTFAVRAFEVSAIDYLLKPFSEARFTEAFDRARRQREQGRERELLRRLTSLLDAHRTVPEVEQPSQAPPPEGYIERIAVRTDGKVLLLPVAELDWCEAEGNYVVLHAGNRSPMLRETLNNVERLLDPRRFVRVHRSTVVNVDRIRELEPDVDKGWVVVLRDGTRLRLSPGRKAAVEALLRQPF
ncbi:LytTR family DNA-binding domain-containing protein [Myxococcus sp. K15C18031901]|uniref:LytR/AlgR family response regulator transcription factor n=1 Tax=Myxococcus dinghuensis TaxID=2906761 RepID=UPI0020A82C01|nr:response regulator [Myxococcus dinghuensis]MCP3103687.1 LytTR family DNA-binding domain-containing protein [Myxococcus dinghuensis]